MARAFDLGAHGYILKACNFAELVHGLRTVAAGRPFLSSAIGLSLLGHLHANSPAAAAAARAVLGLSKRELEVLGLVAEELTNAEIAAKLFPSKRTSKPTARTSWTKPKPAPRCRSSSWPPGRGSSINGSRKPVINSA